MKLAWNLARLLALALAALFAADAALAQQDNLIDTIKKRGKLQVGFGSFVPWAMRDKQGAWVGFEIDVSTKLAKDLGVEVELIPTAFDGIIPALIAGKFDVIISGMSITPERNLTVNFTAPYANTETVLIANKKLAGAFKSLDDFNKPNVVIANRRGATTAVLSEKTFPKAEQLLFDEEGQTLQELINGKAYAALASVPTPAIWVEKYPDVLFVPDVPALEKTSEAFAVRKGDPDALNFYNNWILLHTVDGWLKERHDYWFKGRAWTSQVPEQN